MTEEKDKTRALVIGASGGIGAAVVAAENLLSVIDGLTPEDTGSFRDWAGKAVAW